MRILYNSFAKTSIPFSTTATKVASWSATVLFAIGPVSFLIIDDAGGIVWAISIIAGFAVASMTCCRCWLELRKNAYLILSLCLLLLYLLIPILSYYFVDNSDFAISRIERQFLLIGTPFMFLLLWWLRLSLQTLFVIITMNASVFGMYSIWFFGMYSERVRGVTHAIHFGNISLFLAVASLALFPITHRKGYWIFSIIGMALGCSASLLSGSRGGWIAVPLLFPIALIMGIRAFKLKLSIILGLISITIMVFIGLIHTEAVQMRIDSFQEDLMKIQENEQENSIRVRFLMWEQALLEVRQAPLHGTGFSGYRNRIIAAVESGLLPQYMLSFATEPHNEYLYQLSTRGTIGLTVFLLCLAGIGVYFFKWLFWGNPFQVPVGYIGLSLFIIVAVGGLTITVIDQRAVIRFLSWILALLMYCVWFCKKEKLSSYSLEG